MKQEQEIPRKMETISPSAKGQNQGFLPGIKVTSECTNADLAIGMTAIRIGTWTAAKDASGQLVPLTIRGSGVDKSNGTGVCLYWSDAFVLSQPNRVFRALMVEAFPAFFQSTTIQYPKDTIQYPKDTTQYPTSSKKEVLARLRLYQERGFTNEESVRFEQVRKLERLAEEAQGALSLFLDEATAEGELGDTCEVVKSCLTVLARLEEDMKVEARYLMP